MYNDTYSEQHLKDLTAFCQRVLKPQYDATKYARELLNEENGAGDYSVEVSRAHTINELPAVYRF
jgi:hypothetical protein